MGAKNKFDDVELDWGEAQLKKWQKDLDEHPYQDLEDRTKLRLTKSGGTVLEVIATREAQQKHQRETMKDYLLLFEVIKKLRKRDDDNTTDVGRGGEVIPPRMR